MLFSRENKNTAKHKYCRLSKCVGNNKSTQSKITFYYFNVTEVDHKHNTCCQKPKLLENNIKNLDKK